MIDYQNTLLAFLQENERNNKSDHNGKRIQTLTFGYQYEIGVEAAKYVLSA